jgi:phospholipid transport system substrate-binding protein
MSTILKFAALVITALGMNISLLSAAIDAEIAQNFVENIGYEILTMINDDEMIKGSTELEKILRKYVAFDAVSRFTMGRYWKSMSEDQKKDFSEIFIHRIAVGYLRQIASFRGKSFEVTGAVDAGSRGIVVKMDVSPPKNSDNFHAKPITLEWLVNGNNKNPIIVDLLIEGISMAIMQRTEFSFLLEESDGDINKFMERIVK